MTKWEYKVIKIHNMAPDSLVLELNKLGKEGWELIFMDVFNGQPRAYLKKEIEKA